MLVISVLYIIFYVQVIIYRRQNVVKSHGGD